MNRNELRDSLRKMIAVLEDERQALAGLDVDAISAAATSKRMLCNRLDQATALIVTMDEKVLVSRIVRKLRRAYPKLPIILRARDSGHAAELYRMGASHAVPETLESSLQLSEAVLVGMGVAMGPVIASIHEKRDEFRAQIMKDGQLDSMPKLRTGAAREKAAS